MNVDTRRAILAEIAKAEERLTMLAKDVARGRLTPADVRATTQSVKLDMILAEEFATRGADAPVTYRDGSVGYRFASTS